jgi:hypothetical protein
MTCRFRGDAESAAMTNVGRALGLAMLLALAGCWEFSVPLDPPDAAVIDERLIGSWRCVAPEEDKTMTMEFRRFDKTQLEITLRARDEKDERHRAHTSWIKKHAFLNLRSVDDLEKNDGWILVSYEMPRGSILDLRLVDADALKSVKNDSKKLRKAIQKRIEDQALYHDLCVCIRTESGTEN